MRKTFSWLPGAVAVAVIAGFSMTALAAEGDDDKKEGKRVVCKRVKETGTHFTRKVCLTRENWDEMRREAQEEMDRIGPERSPQSG